MDDITNRLATVYEELQSLDIKPTKNNIMIINDLFKVLEDTHRYLQEMKKEVPVNADSDN